jgi:hypothetical protein
MAFYLGGRFPGVNIESHDIQFYVGKDYKDVLPRIEDNWKGIKSSLHIDSWVVLDRCDHYEISLSDQPSQTDLKLYLINVGFYQKQKFGEYHEFVFVVASSKNDAKKEALTRFDNELIEKHMDDLFDIDDCIEIDKVDKMYVHLKAHDNLEMNIISNGWQRIPKDIY